MRDYIRFVRLHCTACVSVTEPQVRSLSRPCTQVEHGIVSLSRVDNNLITKSKSKQRHIIDRRESAQTACDKFEAGNRVSGSLQQKFLAVPEVWRPTGVRSGELPVQRLGSAVTMQVL